MRAFDVRRVRMMSMLIVGLNHGNEDWLHMRGAAQSAFDAVET